ncbi:MAG: DUF3592 domain-containing protein [Spirochaetota bacterium]
MPEIDGNSLMKSQKDDSSSLWLWIFFLIGCGCIIFASVLLVKNIIFIKNSIPATGTVVDFHIHRGKTFTTYAPIVSFKTTDGKSIKFRSQIGGNSDDYAIGQQVTVLYDPVDPKNAEINSVSQLWFPVIILYVIGLITMAISGGIIYISRHHM